VIKVVLISLAVAIAGLLIYAATRPDSFRIERSAAIRGKPEQIFPLINDFRRWTAWSPWEKIDPLLKRTYSGAESGKGAAYAWEGNSKVGAGSMEITESAPSVRIVLKLDFIKPFEGHNVTEFTLAPGAQGETMVTWVMSGPSPYISKLMGIFFNMDRMIGGQFEQGLANLNAAAATGKETR
jgi:hypothetical protein